MMDAVFDNDPFVIIADIFEKIYPDKKYIASLGYPGFDDDDAYGMTVFREGNDPHIVLFANVRYDILPEIFAHELAHVAVGESHKHDTVWNEAFTKINDEYIARLEVARAAN